MSFDPNNPEDPNVPEDQVPQETPAATDIDLTNPEAWIQSVIGAVGAATPKGGFSPDFRYKPRTVNAIDPRLNAAQQGEINKKMVYTGVADRTGRIYTGEYLIDSGGVVSRAPYDAKVEAKDLLYQMNPNVRANTLAVLARVGMYGSSKPTVSGLGGRDLSAMEDFLTYANAEGLTWDLVLGQMMVGKRLPGGTITGGAKYRVSSAEDIGDYLRKASLERLGRTMTRDDVDTAIASIQRQQAAGQAPSLARAAQQQVSQMNPELERAVSFRRTIDKAMSLLAGG
jgi:hypothetical protein